MSYFVDTNVLVYARDANQEIKQPLAQAWLDHLWATGLGRLSVQVLNEYYVTVTRKLRPGMSASDARADVRDLSTWKPVALSQDLVDQAWVVEDRFGLSYWDSLIVAAAQTAGSSLLLSEDLQHGQQLDEVRVVNPFLQPPPDSPPV